MPGEPIPDDPGTVPRPAPDLGWRQRLAVLTGSGAMAPAAAAVAVAVVAVGVVAYLALRPSPPAPELSLPLASTTAATPTTDPPPTEVVAHAAGAVARPGVYRLDPGARVADLVDAAGGLAPDAAADGVNLAAPLADGAKVYVPREGEEPPPAPTVAPGGGAPGSTAPPAPVDLNTATLAELDALPGVGPTIAQAIVDWRAANGGFSSVDQLLDVRGIGEAKLAELRPLVTV